MAVDLDAVAQRLFADVMAPLVLGGTIRPGHAIGARVALALGEGRSPADPDLASRVNAARVRRARRLAPIDALIGPGAHDWALAAAFHDLLQAANPVFDAPLRRGAARRILSIAAEAIERVPGPATAADALARHTWLARTVDVARTDTAIRWWTGQREFRGVEPPERLQAWPRLRRVSVVRTPRRLLELTPLAVDPAALAGAFTALLARTPLTDLASCTREAPAFAWQGSTLALLATGVGRALAARALARLPAAGVDVALGEATRQLLTSLARAGDTAGEGHQELRRLAHGAVALLAERALVAVEAEVERAGARASLPDRDVASVPSFAAALGSLAARRALAAGDGPWTDAQRADSTARLSPRADSAIGREARRLTVAAYRALRQPE